MKILILSDQFDSGGGAANLVRYMVQGLKNQGHDVTVVVSTQNKTDTLVIRIMGVNENDGIPVYYIYSDYNLFWRSYVSLYNPPAVKAVKKNY